MDLDESSFAQHSTPVVENRAPVAPRIQSNQIPAHPLKKFLLFFGILEIPFPFMAIYVLFSLLSLHKIFGANFVNHFLGLGFFVIVLGVAFAQIAVAILSLDLKLGRAKTKGLIILGLILAVLIIPAIILFIINPIYGNISKVE